MKTITTPKPCRKCGEDRDSEFHIRKDGRREYWCKKCHNIVNKANYQKNKSKIAEFKPMTDEEVAEYIRQHPIKRNLIKNAFIGMRRAGLL